MSKWKRVLRHAVTGYIPEGTGNGIRVPVLNQIKEEPKVTVAEPLKQEEPQKPVPFALTEGERAGERAMSQELSKMPEEEHDEQELKDDDDKPDCFANADGEGGYDEDDARCQHCDLSDDCQSEASDDDDSGEEEPEEPEESKEQPKKVQKKAEPEEDSKDEKLKPDKFTVFKIMRSRVTREDGRVDFINSPRTIGETYSGEPPTKTTIENVLVPQYGGGTYSIMNQSTKQVAGKYQFDGNPKDPDEPANPQPVPMAAMFTGIQPQGQQPVQQVQPQPGQPTLDRIQFAMAQGSMTAVDKLAQLAERFSESGDTEKLDVVVAALKEIATGKRESSSSDKFMEFLMADRQNQQTLLNSIMLEGKKGKEASSSDIVRETMSTMKEMFGLAKEFAPQGEDTGVQMVREVSGVVKDGLKEVTDTVIQITGSKPLKQLDQSVEEKIVYKCEKCGREVQPRWAVCPYCGVKFTGIVTPPPAQAPVVIGQVPTETFRKSAPPLPPEIKDKMDYLRRLAVFIQESHDPVIKGSALLKAAGPEEKVMLLFTASFGYANIMKLAQPWRHSTEIPEGDAIFRVIESANGRLWINKFFAAIRKSAEEEGLVLEQGTINHYLEEINKYSVIKFSFRPKSKPDAGPNLIKQPEMRKVKGQQVGISVCPICQEKVPTLELKEHLFTMHPKKPAVVQQRVAEAIKHGAAVLPRMDQEQVLNLPPLPEEKPEEPLTPNGDGTEED
jgi:rubrerythrin